MGVCAVCVDGRGHGSAESQKETWLSAAAPTALEGGALSAMSRRKTCTA